MFLLRAWRPRACWTCAGVPAVFATFRARRASWLLKGSLRGGVRQESRRGMWRGRRPSPSWNPPIVYRHPYIHISMYPYIHLSRYPYIQRSRYPDCQMARNSYQYQSKTIHIHKNPLKCMLINRNPWKSLKVYENQFKSMQIHLLVRS